jgi:MFS family permease
MHKTINKGLLEAYKASISSFIGTTLEFYDFLLFGFLAPVFGPLFFPSSNYITSILYVYAAFAVGFAFRPLGAIFFGQLGDKKIGRKNVLFITIILMGVVSIGMGIAPTYGEVGITAAVIMVVLRVLQGFALGGEYGGGVTLTSELAPNNRRGFFVGITQLSQSSLLPAGLLAVFTSIFTHSQFVAYGWRILFIIGAIIAVVGVYIRISLTESPDFKEAIKSIAEKKKIAIAEAVSEFPYKIILGILLILGGTVGSYFFGTFGVTYLEVFLHYSLHAASTAVAYGSIMFLIMVMPTAILSDKIGRKPNMIIMRVGILVFIGIFLYMLSLTNFFIIVLAFVIAFAITAFNQAAVNTTIPELFPGRVRLTSTSFIYNFGVGLFGGLTPFIATAILGQFHTGYALALWVVPATAISLIAVLLLKETKNIDMHDESSYL